MLPSGRTTTDLLKTSKFSVQLALGPAISKVKVEHWFPTPSTITWLCGMSKILTKNNLLPSHASLACQVFPTPITSKHLLCRLCQAILRAWHRLNHCHNLAETGYYSTTYKHVYNIQCLHCILCFITLV